MNLPLPVIGWRILYYPDGDLSNPCPADVVQVGQWQQRDKMPVISVNFQQRNSANLSFARTVRHKDDPYLIDHKDLQKFHITGTWDYIPGLIPPATKFPEPPAEVKTTGSKPKLETVK